MRCCGCRVGVRFHDEERNDVGWCIKAKEEEKASDDDATTTRRRRQNNDEDDAMTVTATTKLLGVISYIWDILGRLKMRDSVQCLDHKRPFRPGCRCHWHKILYSALTELTITYHHLAMKFFTNAFLLLAASSSSANTGKFYMLYCVADDRSCHPIVIVPTPIASMSLHSNGKVHLCGFRVYR